LENFDFLRFFEKSEEKVKKMFDNLKPAEYNPDLCSANRLKVQANVSVQPKSRKENKLYFFEIGVDDEIASRYSPQT
jgi:hypothetical protein